MTILIHGDCTHILDKKRLAKEGLENDFALTFLDPPFNQGKDYDFFDDDLPETEYWRWITDVCAKVRELSLVGGAIYFMQREKNAENVLNCLRRAGWTLQNLLIWTKKTSAVPNSYRFGKQYQIIAFATKGPRPRLFNRLRIDPPLRPGHSIQRDHGLIVTDVWDDIREMTSGYFAGEEALRKAKGERAHKQQSPVALLLRIVLSSTMPGDWVLDPFAGTGTTSIVAEQLGRCSVGIEIDPSHVRLINERLAKTREADSIIPLRHYYRHTPGLDEIWRDGLASLFYNRNLRAS
jgi:DNA modification methylase